MNSNQHAVTELYTELDFFELRLIQMTQMREGMTREFPQGCRANSQSAAGLERELKAAVSHPLISYQNFHYSRKLNQSVSEFKIQF